MFVLRFPQPLSGADHHQNGGWASQTLMEGWVITILPQNASWFRSRDEAEQVYRDHFGQIPYRIEEM